MQMLSVGFEYSFKVLDDFRNKTAEKPLCFLFS